MDDELQKLEAELRQLRPLTPRAAVAAELEVRLAPRRRWTPALFFRGALPAAAVVVLAFILWGGWPDGSAGSTGLVRVQEPPAADTLLKPISAENILLAREEEDAFVTLADGTPARRIRESYLDTIVWENAATNASLRWTVPREQVRLVPVFYQ